MDAGGGSMQSYESQYNDVYERISEVEIDASIPVKLLFLLNAMPIENIVKSPEKVKYGSGDPKAVGMRLLELDTENTSKEGD